jgi:hypothetical protein
MVEGEHPATVLAVLSRPGLEDFFAEFSSELAKSGGADLGAAGQSWRVIWPAAFPP